MTDPRLDQVIAAQPHPLLFVTISGAHLYGFASPDSDYDLRGAHVLPLAEVVGLTRGRETIEQSQVIAGVEVDLVTHDARKFFALLLRPNGYVLEQLYSPLIVRTSPVHAELKQIARGCITRRHVHHYLGFFETQWRLFRKQEPPRIKPLLYSFRVLLTGIHLLRTGEVEANLSHLNESFRLPFLSDLIAGPEQGTLAAADVDFYASQAVRLRAALEQAQYESTLPDAPSAQPALHDLLLRLRLSGTP